MSTVTPNKHRQRESKAKWPRTETAKAKEIGAPPERNQALWERYRLDLLSFLIERFPDSTGKKPFSPSHERAIRRLQQAILEGDQQLRIVFRGWGKSTIAENAAIWAAGYGHRSYFVIIGADRESAQTAIDSVQSEFERNDLLTEVFPAPCHCARQLEGVVQRGGTQTVEGQPTGIEWPARHCILPTLPGFEGSGAIIVARGITSGFRGLRFKRPDGEQARPDFVLVDDPQTDASAASPSQTAKRLGILNKTILRLGGHDRELACVINATIIESDDMIDQLSDPKKFPAWRVERVPMLESFSNAHETWLDKYADLRTTHDPDNDDDKRRAAKAATDFYIANREEMNSGAVATWEHCYIDGSEVSAIQHAYNILIDGGEDAFMAECQNKPLREVSGLPILLPDEICRKVSGYGRDVFPAECTTLTAFIDVHPSILYYEVWAWEPRFSGYCIRYGTFPDQRRKYFSHNALARTLQHLFPRCDTSAAITAGLNALLHGYEAEAWDGLMCHEWQRSDGVPMKISRALVDANGEASDVVKAVLRQSPFSAMLSPSFGRGIGAAKAPISLWQQSRGKNYGPEWVPTKGRPGEPIGYTFDTNFWKTRFHRALSLPTGSQGAIYLHKAPPQDHRRIADHWTSERPKEISHGGRVVFEFTQKPATDNHDLDCGVGAMVAASIAGITSVAKKPKPEPQTLAQMAAAARSR